MGNGAKQMKAIAIDKFGGIETLNVKELSRPVLKPNQIMVKTEYAGIGVWDNAEREGVFAKMSGENPEFPEVLGTEGEGIVVDKGKDVKRFSEGDRVYAATLKRSHDNGFYAEYTAVDESNAWNIPRNLKPEQAGALAIDGGTALRGLRDSLKIKEEESLLIFGASGGIGHMAVQLAKRMGAKVFAVASGDDGVALVQNLGADAAVDGHKDDVLQAAKDFAPNGLDAALITSGGEAVQRVLQAMKRNGRVAYPKGVHPEPEPVDQLTVESYQGNIDSELMENLNQLIESEPFEIHVSKTFPMEQIADGQQAIDHHHLGRIILRINSN